MNPALFLSLTSHSLVWTPLEFFSFNSLVLKRYFRSQIPLFPVMMTHSIIKHRDHVNHTMNMITWHQCSHCCSDNCFSQTRHSKIVDWSVVLDRIGCHYPCLSLGVAFSSTTRGQASIFQAAVRSLRLEGLLKPNTVHYSSSLNSTPLPSWLLTPLCPMRPFRSAAQLLSLCTVTIAIYSQQLAL